MDLIIKNASLEEITILCARLGEPGIGETVSELSEQEYKKAEAKILTEHKAEPDKTTKPESAPEKSPEPESAPEKSPEPELHLEPAGVTRKQVIDKALALARTKASSKLSAILKKFGAPRFQELEDKDLEEAFNELTQALKEAG